jgi:hypothetical protein
MHLFQPFYYWSQWGCFALRIRFSGSLLLPTLKKPGIVQFSVIAATSMEVRQAAYQFTGNFELFFNILTFLILPA